MDVRTYEDGGWWLRIGRLSVGRDDPEWHHWRGLAEREGWQKSWRWRGYRVTWQRFGLIR